MERQLTREQRGTASEALRAQYDLYRAMSEARKLKLVFETCRTGRELARVGLRMRYPEASDEQLWRRWARQHLGTELFEAVYGAGAK